MISNVKPLRIGKKWDILDEQITDKTSDEEKLIVLYRNKFLAKVDSGEWTEKEFKNFSFTIKKMYIEAFIDFTGILDCFLELSKDDTLEVMNSLIEKKFIKSEDEINISFLANVIIEICSKILRISYMNISEDEKKVNLSHEELVGVYNSVLEQLDDPNSDYVNLLISTYEEWANNYFSNKKLKDVILSKKEFILKNKQERIRKQLGISLRLVNENMDVHSHYRTIASKNYKIKQFKKDRKSKL